MNETERQIVAWLRDLAEQWKAGNDDMARYSYSVAKVIANNIERGKHRDKQDG